jgi:ADP-ribosylglycohydrolase
MAVVAFLESYDYESAVRNAISYGSDSDTIADMSGAVAEAFYGEVPEHISDFCLSKIPKNQLLLIDDFYLRIGE